MYLLQARASTTMLLRLSYGCQTPVCVPSVRLDYLVKYVRIFSPNRTVKCPYLCPRVEHPKWLFEVRLRVQVT